MNEATGPYLHRFGWLKDDALIGELPLEWNHLVGEYPENRAAKNYHFTLGGPYFPDYDGCEGADEWWENFGEMIYAKTAGLCGKTDAIRHLSTHRRAAAVDANVVADRAEKARAAAD